MTKQTTTISIIATVYFLLFSGVLLFAYLSVRAKQEEYRELNGTLATQIAKEAVARQITEMSSSTAADRAKLKTYFVAEKNTISFINEMEALARGFGVSIDTTSLDMTPATDKSLAILKTGFRVTGREQAVSSFIKAMETLPYHSAIPSIDLSRSEGSDWQATFTLNVTIVP